MVTRKPPGAHAHRERDSQGYRTWLEAMAGTGGSAGVGECGNLSGAFRVGEGEWCQGMVKGLVLASWENMQGEAARGKAVVGGQWLDTIPDQVQDCGSSDTSHDHAREARGHTKAEDSGGGAWDQIPCLPSLGQADCSHEAAGLGLEEEPLCRGAITLQMWSLRMGWYCAPRSCLWNQD